MKFPRILSALLVFCLLYLSACGTVARSKNLFGGDLQVEVSVSAGLNDNTPVAVDLVVVYDKKLLNRLSELSAGDWFQQREQFQRDFPKDFELSSWEWVPGQQVQPLTLSYRVGTAGGLVFADYLQPGAHRLRIDPHEHLRILLGDSSFSVESLKQK